MYFSPALTGVSMTHVKKIKIKISQTKPNLAVQGSEGQLSRIKQVIFCLLIIAGSFIVVNFFNNALFYSDFPPNIKKISIS
jgi:hypothetical protein